MKHFTLLLLFIASCAFAINNKKYNLYNKFYYDRTSAGSEYGEIEITRFYLNVCSSNNFKHFLFKHTEINDSNYLIISTNSDTIWINENSREIQINNIIYYTKSNINLNW